MQRNAINVNEENKLQKLCTKLYIFHFFNKPNYSCKLRLKKQYNSA